MGERTALPKKKRCPCCKRVKDRAEFGIRSDRGTLQSWCKPCKSAEKRRRCRVGVQLELDLLLKKCPGCAQYKLMTEFAICVSRKDGRQSSCRKCMRRNVDRWIQSNRDKHNASTRRWQRANPDMRRATDARRRANQAAAAHIPFTSKQLAARWAYYGDRCWICRARATATDHVKPIAKGGAHMLCNLRPICKPCNSAKNATWPFNPEMICRVAA